MTTGDKPIIWVLPATGTGDNRQLLCLAEALGWPFEVKAGPDHAIRVIVERLVCRWRKGFSRDKRARYEQPWPDLLLFSGGRPVADAWRIRRASGGRTRLVCIGRPWAALARFDLVVTTPQYRLPQRPNVLENLTPLNPISKARREQEAAAWAPRLAHLPRPWLALLVGGDSGSYRFTPNAARQLAVLARDHVRRSGGAVLVSTSARTPPMVTRALEADWLAQPQPVPHFCYGWRPGDPANPLAALLGLADRFLVTGDSAAMVADACATGRPVAIFEPPLRLRTRLATRRSSWADALCGFPAWRDRQVAKGLWFPARDLGRYHRRLEEAGLVVPVAQLAANFECRREAAAGSSALAATLERIRSWFPEADSVSPDEQATR